MARVGKRHLPGLLVLLIVLAIVVPPFVNVSRFKGRIAANMGRALGRPVTFDTISLRLLPQPGFDFENLAIGDDPAFSYEPIVHAESVTAYLRLSSLWRGRLEIARLRLQYPTLNLVSTPEGKLNLESLLGAASRTPAAPTGKIRPETRPRFPYIEAEDGRISFKRGQVKQVFALTEAKFALFSPWEDEWRMRLQAKPVRTDLPLADTGLIRMEGSLHRSDRLETTPVQVTFTMERGQLGQLTRLFGGHDLGWRGRIDASATVAGKINALSAKLAGTVQDFRRYDIVRGEPLQLSFACTIDALAGATTDPKALTTAFACDSRSVGGQLAVKGRTLGWRGQEYSLTVNATDVPMAGVMALARRAKANLPDDLTAEGSLNGSLGLVRNFGEQQAAWTGEGGSITNLVLKSSILGADVPIGKVDFRPTTTKSGSRIQSRIEFEPFPIALGGSTPVATTASISTHDYAVDLTGDATLERLINFSRTAGIAVPKFNFKGAVHLNAGISGAWERFAPAAVNGTMKIAGATAEVPGLNSPVKITSAEIALQQNEIVIRKLNISAESLKATGTAVFPRHCEDDQPCSSTIDAQFDDLDVEQLNAILNPQFKKRPWYRFFGASDERSVLPVWQAKGTVSARKLSASQLSATKVSLEFSLDRGELSLAGIRADLYGGTQTAGSWKIDFSRAQPTYTGSGNVQKLVVAQLSPFLKDLGTGTLSGNYEISFGGSSPSDLVSNASAKCQFTWKDGTLRHLALDGKGAPMHFPQWTGQCAWSKDGFRISESKLQTGSSIYVVSGTVQPNRDLRLQFVRGDGAAYQVTGTLEKPQVAAVPASQTAEAKLQR